jgi:hypothetical protein
MAPTDTNTDRLNWDVYVTPATPIVTRDKPPAVRDTFGQAIASTLIHGMRDAVLVDAFLMVNQAVEGSFLKMPSRCAARVSLCSSSNSK